MADVLDVAPTPVSRVRIVLLVMVVTAIGAALLAYWLWPRPLAPLSRADVEAVHVTSGLTDRARQAVTQPQLAGGLTAVDPERCLPVLTAMAPGLLPGAVDGVRSAGIHNQILTTVTTHRFATAQQADQTYGSVQAALTSCTGRDITLRSGGSRLVTTLSPLEPTQPIEAAQLVYLESDVWIDPDHPDGEFVVRLVEVNNTLTVMYHQLYSQDRDNTRADDLFMAALVERLGVIRQHQDLRSVHGGPGG